MPTTELLNEIKACEERLLHTDFGASPELLDELLALDFEECGQQGEITNRQDVVEWLLSKAPDSRWEFKDFTIKVLSKSLIMARYHCAQITPPKAGSGGSLRLSIWRKNQGTKGWQIFFHQVLTSSL
ncbi:DUF4440 domain-containing protein [Gammaproteobacteria bacterium]|nr:DUF4440 domain-containing protein [Gammaproteobacteria bacterium]